MIFAKVVGTVVATQRNDSLPGAKYLLVECCNHRGDLLGTHMVALDILGTGPGEFVMVSQGPSARQTQESDEKPVDALISGIVDLVVEQGECVFRK